MTFRLTDAGRATSKRPNQKRDCSVRALALACGITYDEAYEVLREGGRKCSTGFDIEAWARKSLMPCSDGGLDGVDCYGRLQKVPYIKDHPAKGTPRRYRLEDFLRDHPKGNFMVTTAKHVIAVVNGVAYDDLPWHYHENRPVYGWIEVMTPRLPLWRVFALRKPMTKKRSLFKRSVAIVEGVSYKLAMKTASKQYEWALRPNEDLTVEPYDDAP